MTIDFTLFNMKKLIQALCLLLVIIKTSSTFAYLPKEGNVSALLGPFFFRTNIDDSRIVDNSYLNDVGVIALGDINTKGSLEISIFHMRKLYVREQEPGLIAEKTELMHIGMGYRYYLNSYFSTALTFYSAYSMGEPSIIYNTFTPATQIDTSARDKTEYGLDFSLQTEIAHYQRYALVLDTRYSMSVTNKSREHGDHYGALLAIRYLVQEKSPDTKAPVK